MVAGVRAPRWGRAERSAGGRQGRETGPPSPREPRMERMWAEAGRWLVDVKPAAPPPGGRGHGALPWGRAAGSSSTVIAVRGQQVQPEPRPWYRPCPRVVAPVVGGAARPGKQAVPVRVSNTLGLDHRGAAHRAVVHELRPGTAVGGKGEHDHGDPSRPGLARLAVRSNRVCDELRAPVKYGPRRRMGCVSPRGPATGNARAASATFLGPARDGPGLPTMTGTEAVGPGCLRMCR